MQCFSSTRSQFIKLQYEQFIYCFSKVIFFITFSFVGEKTITIIDAQANTPIQNVNVYADSVGIISDRYGSCSLDTFKRNDQITFSMIGYKTITLPYKRISEMIYL